MTESSKELVEYQESRNIIHKIKRKVGLVILKILDPFFYTRIEKKLLGIQDLPRPFIHHMVKENGINGLIGAEIGVYKGLNAVDIYGRLHLKKMYLVDIWPGDLKDQTMKNLDKNLSLVQLASCQLLHMTSKKAAEHIEDNELDFVYIDADHTYNAVSEDMELYWHKIKKGGYMAGHDMLNNYEVTRAVLDWAYNNQKYVYISPPDWWILK